MKTLVRCCVDAMIGNHNFETKIPSHGHCDASVSDYAPNEWVCPNAWLLLAILNFDLGFVGQKYQNKITLFV